VGAAIERLDPIIAGEANLQFEGALTRIRLEHLWLTRARQDPMPLAADVLARDGAGSDTQFRAEVLATVARIQADRALDPGLRDDARAAARAGLEATAVIPMADAPQNTLPPSLAAALVTAEVARGRAVDPTEEAERWAAVGEVATELGHRWHRIYAGWRRAEALVAAGTVGAAAEVAAGARTDAVAIEARPLVDELDALSRRARLGDLGAGAVTDAPSASGEPAPRYGDLGLTPREVEVLALLAEGRTNGEIGAALYISTRTAGVHVSNILAKLGVRSRTQAAAVAHRVAPPR
jgi:DNA-binding CsgD family transcriptional regulator